MSTGFDPALQLPRDAGRSAFGADPALYDRARADYPPAMFAAIGACLPSGRQPAIVEVGAGTGLATRRLLDFRPARLIAVEPDPALAGYLRDAIRDPAFRVVDSAFLDARLPAGNDLLLCASAFHWLDPVPALAAIKALLRPGGTIALCWNVYRQPGTDDPFTQAVAPLLRDVALAPSESAKGHYGLDQALHRTQLDAAGFRDVRHIVFDRLVCIGAERARELFQSYSFVAALAPERRERLLGAVAAIVDKRFGGRAPVRVLTPLYLGTRA